MDRASSVMIRVRLVGNVLNDLWRNKNVIPKNACELSLGIW